MNNIYTNVKRGKVNKRDKIKNTFINNGVAAKNIITIKDNQDGKKNVSYTLNYGKNSVVIIPPLHNYYPECKKDDEKSTALNDSSIIVQLKGTINGVFMGDVKRRGLKRMVNYVKGTGNKSIYASLLNPKLTYDLVEYGHHGYRLYTDDDHTRSECKFYNTYLKSKSYIFSCSNHEYKLNPRAQQNKNIIRKALSQKSHFFYTQNGDIDIYISTAYNLKANQNGKKTMIENR